MPSVIAREMKDQDDYIGQADARIAAAWAIVMLLVLAIAALVDER